MSTKIGHFEILSELAKSATGTVYKANDPKSGQTVRLEGDPAVRLWDARRRTAAVSSRRGRTTKVLSHPQPHHRFRRGEIDGQFCAAMEYVQGNSIATMLARKEGFSSGICSTSEGSFAAASITPTLQHSSP